MAQGILILIGVLLNVILITVYAVLMIKAFKDAKINNENTWVMLFIISMVLILAAGAGFFIGLILIFIYWSTKGGREIRQQEKKELRKAQMTALKKGAVKVDIKGKMSKLR